MTVEHSQKPISLHTGLHYYRAYTVEPTITLKSVLYIILLVGVFIDKTFKNSHYNDL